jgi:hypothetical protein
MRIPTSRPKRLVVMLVGFLAIVACGGSDDGPATLSAATSPDGRSTCGPDS